MRNNKNKLIIHLFSIFITQYLPRGIIFCFLFLWGSILNSQDTWLHTYSPFYIDDGWYDVEDVIVCLDGGYAVNGTYVEYDAEMGIEWAHWGFLMKTDSDGNFLWVKADTISFMYENNSLAFVQTSDGGFISAVSGGNLIKRDLNGNREWVINGDFGINSICNISDGNIILGGCQNLNIGLRKIDENGNTLWTQVYQIDDDYSVCKSIIQTQDGGFALTGYLDYEGRSDFDVLVMKSNANGDSLWTRLYDAFGDHDQGNCIIENSYGDIIVCGYVMIPDPFHSEGLIWLMDSNGTTYWTQHVNVDFGYRHFSLLNLSDNSFTALCNSPDGTKVYNFDNFYNITWESVLPGWAAEGDRGFKKLQDSGYVIGGTYPWCSNIMLAKTDDYGNVTAVDDYILKFQDFELSNFPNPFNPSTTISYTLSESGFINLSIYNIKGQKIESLINELKPRGVYNIEWNGLDLNNKSVGSGIYFVNLTINSRLLKTHKILLIK